MHLFKTQLFQEVRPLAMRPRRFGVRSRPRAGRDDAIAAGEPRLLELEALHILHVGRERVAVAPRAGFDRAA